nr:MAG TPA: hypothetical protein [Caudoviricetes sp.]
MYIPESILVVYLTSLSQSLRVPYRGLSLFLYVMWV